VVGCSLPGGFWIRSIVDAGYEGFEAARMCQIVGSAGGTACFHGDKVDFAFLEEGHEVISIGGGIEELMLSSFCVQKKAAYCVGLFLLI
jgi:hypothetical protein